MNLNDFAKECLEISDKRKLDENTVLDYLKHCSGEVLEAVDAYIASGKKRDFELELADIIICVLLVSAKEQINIEQALKDAMEKNRARIK